MTEQILDFGGQFHSDGLTAGMKAAEKGAADLEAQLKGLVRQQAQLDRIEQQARASAITDPKARARAFLGLAVQDLKELKDRRLEEAAAFRKQIQERNAFAEKVKGEFTSKEGFNWAGAVSNTADVVLSVGAAAAAAAVGLVAAAKGFAEVAIESATAKKAMIGSLTAVLGGDEGVAKKRFDDLQRLGIQLGLGADRQVELYKTLAGFGFDDRRRGQLIAASADIGFRQGGTEQGMAAGQAAIMQLVRLASTGKLDGRGVYKFALASAINPDEIYKNLAASRGVSVEQAKKMGSKAGTFSKDEILDAVLGAVAGPDGKLGDLAAKRSGDSVYAQKNRIKDILDDMIEDTDTGPVAHFYKRVADAFDTDGEGGAALKREVTGLANEIVSLFNIGDSSTINGFVRGLVYGFFILRTEAKELRTILGYVIEDFERHSGRSENLNTALQLLGLTVQYTVFPAFNLMAMSLDGFAIIAGEAVKEISALVRMYERLRDVSIPSADDLAQQIGINLGGRPHVTTTVKVNGGALGGEGSASHEDTKQTFDAEMRDAVARSLHRLGWE